MALYRQSFKLSTWNTLTLLLLHLAIFEFSAQGSLLSYNTTFSKGLAKRYIGDIRPPKSSPGPDESNYPNDDEIRSAYMPSHGPSVFYSGIGDGDQAEAFAVSIGGIILKDAFPTNYTRYGGRGSKWYGNYIDRASGIFAEKASGEVFFVGMWNLEVDRCRVWGRIEYPSLLANPHVTKVTLVDYSNFANKRDYPGIPGQNSHRPKPVFPVGAMSIPGGPDIDFCFDWEGDQEDPLDPASDPQLDVGYYPGNCGVHVVQYQKNEKMLNPNPDYRLDITLEDDQHETIGQMLFADAPAGQDVDVDSALPLVFIATAQNVDSDPLKFRYGGQNWNSSSSQCSSGGYDSGTRKIDCGFSC